METIDEKMKNKSKNVKVSSLFKALLLLDYFKESEKSSLSATELANYSGLLITSVHNIMSTFMEYGLIQKNPSNHKYSIGKKFAEFSNIYLTQNTAQKSLSKIINSLADETGETILLAVPSGTEVLYLDSASPKNSLTPGNRLFGVTAPMYCTSLGKALLAVSEPDILEQALSEKKIRFTQNTITDRKKLEEELAEIRRRGYAVDNMEHEYGVTCVGIALKVEEQLYGLSISGPSLRFPKEKIELYALKLLTVKQSFI